MGGEIAAKGNEEVETLALYMLAAPGSRPGGGTNFTPKLNSHGRSVRQTDDPLLHIVSVSAASRFRGFRFIFQTQILQKGQKA